MKTALITGSGGQDGSYLTEHLTSLGYRVFCGTRRQIAPREIQSGQQHFIYCDVRDELSIRVAFKKAWPDEIYNLAGQVYVPLSWEQPAETFDVNTNGLARILKVVEQVKRDTRVYQASSSEMFGNHAGGCYENTVMNPTSPYGVSKYAAHRLVGLYRSKGLYVVAGILFNHECVAAHMPILVKKHGLIDVIAIEELLAKCYMDVGSNAIRSEDFEGRGIEIWDGDQWTEIKAVTATSRKRRQPEHDILSVQARGGSVEVTRHHRMLRPNGDEISAGQVKEGSSLKMSASWSGILGKTILTEELAELLGLLVAEGSGTEGGLAFTNKDQKLLTLVRRLWKSCFAGWVGSIGQGKPDPDSEFYNEDDPTPATCIRLIAPDSSVYSWIHSQIYTRRLFKKVPQLVLNSSESVIRAFLKGYYAGDGLKAGRGESVKTNSAVLAQGLVVLYGMLSRVCSVYVEHRDRHVYYQMNVSGEVNPGKGQHLRKDQTEVRKVLKVANVFETAHRIENRDWVLDVETDSGLLCAGVGRLVVHNSPRRGSEMVTKKIARQVAEWAAGSRDMLMMGSLDSKRDWGFAGDYVKAMHLMLQHDKPQDYVVGTSESHSVADFLETARIEMGLEKTFVESHTACDQRFVRQQEIYDMVANTNRVRQTLGWEPTVNFRELVRMMVWEEYNNLSRGGSIMGKDILQPVDTAQSSSPSIKNAAQEHSVTNWRGQGQTDVQQAVQQNPQKGSVCPESLKK